MAVFQALTSYHSFHTGEAQKSCLLTSGRRAESSQMMPWLEAIWARPGLRRDQRQFNPAEADTNLPKEYQGGEEYSGRTSPPTPEPT